MIEANVTEFHTFVAKLKDFIGTFKIQGSCSDTAHSGEPEWFDIDVINYDLRKPLFFKRITNKMVDTDDDKCKCCECCCDEDDLIIVDKSFTGNISRTYQLNCLWVRFQYSRLLDTDATVEEVDYRN